MSGISSAPASRYTTQILLPPRSGYYHPKNSYDVSSVMQSNPSLSHCPTNNCDNYFFSSQPDSKRVVCDKCQSSFWRVRSAAFKTLSPYCVFFSVDISFVCGSEYHLPCCCRTIRQWWKKVMDDADTSSYISSHTKDVGSALESTIVYFTYFSGITLQCPNCESSIEKNGGCNHLICRQCKYEFCWVCLEGKYIHPTSSRTCGFGT